MSDQMEYAEVPIGHYLALVREEAGLTQGDVAGKVTFSAASISRIESGDKPVSPDELTAILDAIGSPKAKELREYLRQEWDALTRPPFDHPDRRSLWETNLALRKLDQLRQKPDLLGVFLRQVDLYEKELRRLASFLRSREHQVAFIGTIGVGKSTAICKFAGLLKPGESKLDKEIVLETGAGGITICEVEISQGPKYGLRIVPRTDDSIRKDVEEFAEYLVKSARPESTASKGSEEDGDSLGISKEVVRAIRNMACLTETRKEEGGRKVRVDPARELAAQYPKTADLAIQILTKMDLLRRHRRDAWYPDDCTHPPMVWLQDLFAKVNNGRHEEFTLPLKIEVIVPDPVFASKDVPVKVVDTKGVDQTAERQDLECHFDDPRTLVVLCTRFNDAPDIATQSLLQRANEAGVKDLVPKTVLLVLPRPDEALAVKHDGGARVEDEEEGHELKKDQIDLRLGGLGIGNLPVVFYNAKEAPPEQVRDGLIDKIKQYRQGYCAQIARLSITVDHLIENQENETIRLVFEQVEQRLTTWIDKYRELEWDELQVQGPLVTAIANTRYASVIRAAVRRMGNWTNLDYYYHLGVGSRRIGVRQIGSRVRDFKVIVQNLIDDNELAPASEFLNRVLANLDARVDRAYRNIQLAGQEAFREALEADLEFWGRCIERWGAGPGYRNAIREKTEEQFQTSYEDARETLKDLIAEEWHKVIGRLEGMLKEKEGHEVTPKAE